MAHKHNHHSHTHSHGDQFDPGEFYKQAWVQEQLQTLDAWLKENSTWIGVDSSKPQRVLDYACGNGTVSKALLPSSNKQSSFHGLDASQAQIARFNAEAERLAVSDRMAAVVGDLSDPSSTSLSQTKDTMLALDYAEWNNFDLAISSMALHHFADPVAMLRALASRVRGGAKETFNGVVGERISGEAGAVVILDHCPVSLFEQELSSGDGDGDGGDATLDGASMLGVPHGNLSKGQEKGHEHHHGHGRADVNGHQHVEKIWPGFPPKKLAALFRAAGLEGVEIKVHPGVIRIPRTMEDGMVDVKEDEEKMQWSESKLLLAKGYVA